MFEYTSYDFNHIYNRIKNRLTLGVAPASCPVAYILGGQPGAGKTILQNQILENDYNCIIINADVFREKHPYFSEIQATFGDDSPKYTQPFINSVTEKLIRELSEEKYNLIIEGTLRTAETPINTCKMLKDKGYCVELHIISVRKEISYESTILRYEIAIASGDTPRATAKEHHDLVADSIVKNLDTIYRFNIFDKIKLFTRSGHCIYPNGNDISPSIIEKEVLFGEWNNCELSRLQDIISKVKQLKSERKAPDLEAYTMRTDKLIKSISVSSHFFKVTKQEADFLCTKGVKYDGKVSENDFSVIKISNSEKDNVLNLLEKFRHKNTLKK